MYCVHVWSFAVRLKCYRMLSLNSKIINLRMNTADRIQDGTAFGQRLAVSTTDWQGCQRSTTDDSKASASMRWVEVQSRWPKKTLRWCRSWYRPRVRLRLQPEWTGCSLTTDRLWSVLPRFLRPHVSPERHYNSTVRSTVILFFGKNTYKFLSSRWISYEL